MDARLKAALAAALGSDDRSARGLAGGDINRAYEVTLADGRRLFVKTNDASPRGMFAAEARGLAWLAEAGALRIPGWSRCGAGDRSSSWFSSWWRPARRRATSTRSWGAGWPRCIAAARPASGSTTTTSSARCRRRMPPAGSWPEFYRARRLEAQLRRAVDEGRASLRMRQGFERLFRVLDELCGPAEPPARLHGDLWGGNLLCDDRGAPCLIDPGRLRRPPGD